MRFKQWLMMEIGIEDIQAMPGEKTNANMPCRSNFVAKNPSHPDDEPWPAKPGSPGGERLASADRSFLGRRTSPEEKRSLKNRKGDGYIDGDMSVARLMISPKLGM